MTDLRPLVILGGLTLATAAVGMPWDLDMVDSESVKAFEQPMAVLPEGVMSQENLLTPIAWRKNLQRESAAAQATTNPITYDDRAAATGEKMYTTYCTPCHGDGVTVGPVGEAGRFPGVVALAGDAGRLQHVTDGHVYFTIRNGGAIMPGYGHAMDDREMWSLVGWMRANLPNSKAPVPRPAPAEEAAP